MADDASGQPESKSKAKGGFKPGISGNPGGYSKRMRELHGRLREALDAAFTREDGTDVLVDALVAGVRTGDSTCIKLSCEYRFGRAPQAIELTGADGEPVLVQARKQAERWMAKPETAAALLALAEAAGAEPEAQA